MSDTETVSPRYADVDSWPTVNAVEAMLEGQFAALATIKSQTAAIATAADAAADRLKAGGRIVYVGAGTSGRIAVQDGVELGPTFGWPDDRIVLMMAGGLAALSQSVEGAEDDAVAARTHILHAKIGADDVIVGLAASGKTPFTVAAILAAREVGALTISLANNPGTPLLAAAEHGLLCDTGSEIVAGSTRMKAGTAQKAVLNILSTAIMIRLGRVYRGRMVDMVISNEKLQHRAQNIVKTLATCSDANAIAALDVAHNEIKPAILIAMGMPLADAQHLLEKNEGILRLAVAEAEKGNRRRKSREHLAL
jgi:N-acetylmuramic acid 6-phosphate etherase